MMPRLRSLALLVLICGVAPAEDWPQWLGPRRDGSSKETVRPWKEAPKVLWRKAAGEGHSSPIVADGKVFLHTKVKGKDAEEVAAYNAEDGNELWTKEYERGPLHEKFIRQFGVGPRSTPTYQDGKLYTERDDRFTCAGTDQMVADCAALRPDARCVLDSPPGYWWQIRCKGTAPSDEEEMEEMQRLQSLAVPSCECTCDPSYYEAADRLDAERERCSRVP